jgi:hypothetical protein
MLKNAGKEQQIDLLEQRIKNAEATMANLISAGLYSDGTGDGGKQITGLDAAVPTSPTTGTYGGIDRALWTFWRSVYTATAATTSNIWSLMTTKYASLTRGADKPNLIIGGSTIWGTYVATLQGAQRFTDAGTANLGFSTVKFMGADVVLDGGIGGDADADTMFFLNTKYLFYRPHAERDMVALGERKAVNQDAMVQILAWAGNLTCSGAQFQGRLNGA